MTLSIDGIENPSSTGSFRPSLTLTNYNGDTISTEADLTIVDGEPFFESTITSVPSSFTVSNSIQIDYEIENTGDQTDTQTIRLLVDGTQEDSTSVTLDPQVSTTGSFSYTPTSSDGDSLDITVESDDDSDAEIVTKGNTFTISLDPTTAGDTDSIHTWSADTVSESDFNDDEDIETIDVDYSDNNQGSTLDTLDETDITVEMTRELSSGPDRSTIDVNSGDYSGDTATFDLSGNFTTDITNDPNNPDIVVTIGDSSNNTGAENPSQGSYTATITLNGGQGSTVSDTVSYDTT
jgi:CARDB.